MYAEIERPASWFSPDPTPVQDAIECLVESDSYVNSCFDDAASQPGTWQLFLGDSLFDENAHGQAVKTSSGRYQDADYSRLSMDELLVLLMDGSNEQTLRARFEIRDRLKANRDFLRWVAKQAEADVIAAEDDCDPPENDYND